VQEFSVPSVCETLPLPNTLDAPAENVTFFNVGLMQSRMNTLQKRLDALEKELAEARAGK